jgi:ABC-type sugar transport system substrate-binding protein
MNSQRTFTLKKTTTRLWPVCGITAGAAALAAILAASVVSAGCDSASFVPPPPPELNEPVKPGSAATYEGSRSAATSSVPAAGKRAGKGVRIVELILARPPDADRLYFEQVLRRELAKVLIPLRCNQPDPQKRSSPEDLAGAIRAAVSRGVAGVVIEPSDEAVVIDALYDAVGRGVAVLLLDRPVAVRGGKSMHWVEYTAFADVGRQIVAAVLEADRNQKPAKPGRIVFLHHRSDDPYLERSFKSLVEPAKAAGKTMEMLEFDGDLEDGMAALRKSLEADPDIDILLADDALGVYVGFRIHVERTTSGRRGFLLAGYTPNDYRIVTFLDRIYVIGDRSVESYASKTSRAIRSLMEGKTVGELVEVPVTFNLLATIPSQPQKQEATPRGAGSPKS